MAPVASDFLARVSQIPPGLDAKVVDGDQQMWLQVPRRETVVVLDYQGAPYLRFSGSGVDVNQNSTMYYLNQTPVSEIPPSNLTRSTPPQWHPVSGAHAYLWHDGRLHALAVVALSPESSYVGRWSIPLLIDGRLLSISGGLWHDGAPPIVWFWPIVVILACVAAAWRVRRPQFDAWVARWLAIASLLAISAAAIGRDLHGRPTLSILQLIELGIILGFVGWSFARVLMRRAAYPTSFAVAFVALWEGSNLIPTLLNGYVLVALPAFAARAAATICLGAGAGLLLLSYHMAVTSRRTASISADREETVTVPSAD